MKSFDIDGDGKLNHEEIAAVVRIDLGGYDKADYHDSKLSYESIHGIKSLKGIEYFRNLQILDCSFNHLEELDIGSFPNLRYLNCAGNIITSLDTSNNPELEILWCCLNKIASLDVSSSTNLQELYCWNNELSELDIRNNTNLEVLFCAKNNLTALDISRNTKLRSISCGRNSIRTLDFSNTPSLSELYSFRNKLGTINTNDNHNLLRLSLTDNNLGIVNITSNAMLRAFDCEDNYLASLDVSRNTALEELYFSSSTIRNIDLSANTALISLDCSYTNLMTLDLSRNNLLRHVDCYGNSRLEALHLISSDTDDADDWFLVPYPSLTNIHYQTDMREYVGENLDRVSELKGYSYLVTGEENGKIKIDDSSSHYVGTSVSDGIVNFSSMPHFIRYEYDTRYSGSALESSVPRKMSVRVSLPLDSFIYIPEPGSETPTESALLKSSITM